MDLHQYFDEAMPQMDSFEDESSLDTWKCSSNAVVDSDRNASFDCNICLECVQDPVVTLCGHLYCWPCIYKWFQSVSSENGEKQIPQCPVCKSEISQSSLVPLYGRGQTTSSSSSSSSEYKSHNVGIAIPRRPLGPRSSITPAASQPTSRVYQSHHRNHPQQFTSIPGTYTSPMFNTGGSLANPFNTAYGVFGETLYARVFGNQVTNVYTYPNSYHLSGNTNPRIRRHLMEADKSLGRICFFLLCCALWCLISF